MKTLVTGFKPFLGEKLNPSELLALELEKEKSNVTALILPVEFGRSFEVLREHLILNQYDQLIMLGQAAGRKNVCLEKVALNWVQSEHKDEAGVLPPTGNIFAGESLAFMTRFDVDGVFNNLKNRKLPVEISFSAGTYVCNDLYFRVLREFTELTSVFVHVPLVEEQKVTDKPFMTFVEMRSVLLSLI